MHLLKHLFLFIALLFSFLANCQETFFRHYSTNEGLPSSETYSVHQDRKGYIWIATDMGVSRFDGYSFKNFTTADGLVDNTIFNFYEDPIGRLWFISFSGRLSFFFNDTIYGQDFEANKKIRNFIGSGYLTGIRNVNNDTLLITTFNGLLKVIPEKVNGKITWTNIEQLDYGKMFLVKNGYILTADDDKEKLHTTLFRKGHKISECSLPANYYELTNVLEIENGIIQIFCTSATHLLDSNGRFIKTIRHPASTCSLYENDSLVWLGAKDGGIKLYNINTDKAIKKTLLQGLTVSGITRDKENGYWFTTTQDGLFYLATDRFTHYTEKQVPKGNVTAIVPFDSSTFFVAEKIMLVAKGIEEPKPVFPVLGTLQYIIKRHMYYWNCFLYKPHELWVSANNGIAIINTSTGKLEKFIDLFKGERGPEYDSRIVINDSKGLVWTLNLSQLIKIDPIKRAIIKYVPIPARAQTVCEDYNGNMLVGTINGMYALKNDSLHYLGDKNSIFKNRFVDIKRSSGLVIAASRGAGLFVIDGDKIHQYTTKDGLRSNMCRAIYIDTENTIWLATNNGINSIKLDRKTFTATINSLSVYDGLLSNDIEQVTRTKKDLWLYSKKGLTVFNPDSVLHNTYPPPVYITRLTIDNDIAPIKSINQLSYSTNFIGIDFIGLTYKNAGRQTYKYRLEGYDTSWAYTTNTFVQFTKLPPGDYRFLVKCINNSGIESTNPAVFAFTINTPFYLKWWFWFGLMIMAIVLVITGSVYTITRIREREELKTEVNRKIANLELQALRAQMNPHFIFNCLNAIQDFIIKNDAQSARRYLTSFAKLIRITLNNSRRQNVPLTEEIDFLRLYMDLERMRFNDTFSYTVNLPAGVNGENIEVPSMILQPLVENAIRHGRMGHNGEPGLISISFAMEDTILVCSVEDNGVGYNQSAKREYQPGKKQTHALDIISDRIKTIGEINKVEIRYTIEDKSDLDAAKTGTIVKLYIPLKHTE
ncbi:MAG TPA: histidine kinase [Chitinophagales bacterium]|nr:histidine kinase [Chitinophagales bacterium]